MKQQDIMVYFKKKDISKTFETGNCQNGKEASITRSIASVDQSTKITRSDKLNVTGESRKRKGEFVRQLDKSLILIWLCVVSNRHNP